jgi:hypothetical protein
MSPGTKNDKQMAWVILALGVATTSGDKAKAIQAWRDCQLLLCSQTLKDMVQASTETGTCDSMLESLARQVVGRFMEKESAGVLPVAGAALGAWGEVSLIKDVSLAARRVYQVRWLVDNQKLEPGAAQGKGTGE